MRSTRLCHFHSGVQQCRTYDCRRLVQRARMKACSIRSYTSLLELASEVFDSSGSEKSHTALRRILDIRAGHAICKSTPELKDKFGVAEDNDQLVVSVTDRQTARTKKPQTFTADSQALPDGTDNGQNCDFCKWETLTATDTFGRVENESCVTASNLFKYAFPCHGLVLFKHHNPLSFSLSQVQDLLSASAGWFERAQDAHPKARWPFFLWNCLPRAGASQFHGHAQTILTEEPTPAARSLEDILQGYEGHSGRRAEHASSVQEAYQSIGLLRTISSGNKDSCCYACLAPVKDMEVGIFGEALTCPAFARLLHGVLRSLIDQLSVTSFNVAIFNIPPSANDGRNGPMLARVVSRGSLGSKASDFGALEVFGQASIGHTDPYAVIAALDAQMQGVQGYSKP